MEKLTFKVGNTYKRITDDNANLDRTGRHLKIHDWVLYCEIVDGDPDLIQSVTFDMKNDSFSPRKFTCHCPIRYSTSSSLRSTWRFCSRQVTWGGVNAEVSVRGRGGTVKTIRWDVVLEPGGGSGGSQEFIEPRSNKQLKPVKMAEENFGVELEMTCAGHDPAELIAQSIKDRSSIEVKIFGEEQYTQAKQFNRGWKIMSDSSLACNLSQPDCNKYELVSRILKGGSGLNEVYKVLGGVEKIKTVKLNKSAGFHVHIDVASMNLSSLKKICQVFVKYEDAMDTIMPPSRRTKTPENEYCKSNKIALDCASNLERNSKIASAPTMEKLCDIMNPNNDRHYKLNLLNLKSGRQKTLEFRQHSATTDYEKVSNWVRFCMSMVINAARLRPPKAFKEDTRIDTQFSMMFDHMIKDRCVRNFYAKRKAALTDSSNGNDDGDCCDGCLDGSGCAISPRTAQRTKRQRVH